MAAEAGAGLRVDHLGAVGRELLEGRGDVAYGDADVVHPGAAACQEAPDVGVLAERGDQLDPAGSEAQVGSLDALRLEPVARTSTSAPKRSGTSRPSVEVLDGEGDVRTERTSTPSILTTTVERRRRGAS